MSKTNYKHFHTHEQRYKFNFRNRQIFQRKWCHQCNEQDLKIHGGSFVLYLLMGHLMGHPSRMWSVNLEICRKNMPPNALALSGINSKKQSNIYLWKNCCFFKIVTNHYLKMYSLLIIIGWAYTPHICNKH